MSTTLDPQDGPSQRAQGGEDLQLVVESLEVENRRITEELQRLQNDCAELVVVREQQRIALNEQREAVRDLTRRLKSAESRARRVERSRAYRAARAVRRVLGRATG